MLLATIRPWALTLFGAAPLSALLPLGSLRPRRLLRARGFLPLLLLPLLLLLLSLLQHGCALLRQHIHAFRFA